MPLAISPRSFSSLQIPLTILVAIRALLACVTSAKDQAVLEKSQQQQLMENFALEDTSTGNSFRYACIPDAPAVSSVREHTEASNVLCFERPPDSLSYVLVTCQSACVDGQVAMYASVLFVTFHRVAPPSSRTTSRSPRLAVPAKAVVHLAVLAAKPWCCVGE
ncbi:hypothetical protein C8F01DRAFT_1318837 [Mycena amicta]|nr:hypothetical protein C8F01DRAFT_1318837 [Mycena amicta]